MDLLQLALYDVIILADDSGSMQQDSRADELKVIAGKVAWVATHFDDNGISLVFLNKPQGHDGVRSPDDVSRIVAQTPLSGSTPLGPALRRKVLEPYFFGPARGHTLPKPVLVIIITDGEPDNKQDVYQVLAELKQATTQMRSKACGIEVAQVGNDPGASRFLNELDADRNVGDVVDVTSSFELEEMQYRKMGATLTPEMWMVKLMLGGIDPNYDAGDE